jgi:hypothetical protein
MFAVMMTNIFLRNSEFIPKDFVAVEGHFSILSIQKKRKKSF